MTATMRKDPTTGAVMNDDVSGFERYKMRRRKVIEQININDRVSKLEDDISEIKQILNEIRDGMA